MKKNLNYYFLFAVIFAFTIFSSTVFAHYTTTGWKYADPSSLYVQFDSSMSSTTNNGDTYNSIASDALFEWSSGMNYDIKFYDALGSGNYDIHVAAYNYGDTDWNGRALPTGVGFITSLSTVQLNRYYMDSYTFLFNRGVAAHEFGHSLGLGHVTDVDHVMSTHNDGRIATKPHSHDIAGVKAIYGY